MDLTEETREQILRRLSDSQAELSRLRGYERPRYCPYPDKCEFVWNRVYLNDSCKCFGFADKPEDLKQDDGKPYPECDNMIACTIKENVDDDLLTRRIVARTATEASEIVTGLNKSIWAFMKHRNWGDVF